MAGRGLTVAVFGTASHVGKSLVVAGLCRMLARRGIRVAPFKAMNMSNNATVTLDGAEIGLAQAVQAEAAGIEPTAEMNPLLLKPTAGRGFQVIHLGRALGHVTPRRWGRIAPRLWPRTIAAGRRLIGRHDVVIIEGAGGAAEPNLRRTDPANFRVAHALRAPVLLVGSIEFGGVFAALAGTVAALPATDRRLIRGLLINNHHGDPALLGMAPSWLRERTGVPVLGVLPHLDGLGFPEEDDPPQAAGSPRDRAGRLRVEVVRLPGVSNFTDLDAFRAEPDVDLVWIDAPQSRTPAVLILPGSKNTIESLGILTARGLDRYLVRAARAGAHVVGLCGGYQMLGSRVDDPHGAESRLRRVRGLGVLSVTTRFAGNKTTVRVRARHRRSGLLVDGFEMHMGRTTAPGSGAVFDLLTRTGREGCENASGRVWGTYLHGVFDEPGFRRWFLDRIRLERGWPPVGRLGRPERERRLAAYNRIADALEASIGWHRVRSLIDNSR